MTQRIAPTSRNPGSAIRISMWPHPSCGTRTDTFLVITGKPGVYEDASFSIVVP
ncbi:hypothetical protein [Streptomyces sp. KS 21]|uniref:hypothetical protein n=1 Tax=Streptomyces sp. KS 21 TaxID=2485150 RepID=UPI00141529BB|nr:hypothetical protein [Streptomyces sp. KS 21]